MCICAYVFQFLTFNLQVQSFYYQVEYCYQIHFHYHFHFHLLSLSLKQHAHVPNNNLLVQIPDILIDLILYFSNHLHIDLNLNLILNLVLLSILHSYLISDIQQVHYHDVDLYIDRQIVYKYVLGVEYNIIIYYYLQQKSHSKFNLHYCNFSSILDTLQRSIIQKRQFINYI